MLAILTLYGSGCVAQTGPGYWNPNGADTGVEVQPQEANYWCWAAVSQALLSWRGVEKSQGQLASEEFHRDCMMDYPNGSKECNHSYHITQLDSIGVYLETHNAPLSEEELKIALTSGEPVIILYSNHGANHFRTITGYGAAAHATGFVVQDSAADLGQTMHDLQYSELLTMREPWDKQDETWTKSMIVKDKH